VTEPRRLLLEEAIALTTGPRVEAYGDPGDHFRDVAAVWTVQLRGRLTGDLGPADVCRMLAALKLCREVASHRRDNLVDGAAYLGLAGELEGDAAPGAVTGQAP
jgi:hypothetical protein